jgi:predicted DNA-binding transcriptional regulator AlpA
MTHQSHPNDPPPVNDELLTISEVAAIVRAPIATLRYGRHLGHGPRSFRLGRRVVYRVGDLRAWIDLQASASDAGTAASEQG